MTKRGQRPIQEMSVGRISGRKGTQTFCGEICQAKKKKSQMLSMERRSEANSGKGSKLKQEDKRGEKIRARMR